MKTTALSMTFVLALGTAAGCSSSGTDDPDPAGAKLTIVGERSLLLEHGWATELTVLYTDLADQPLAGQIAFSMNGEASGAFLSDRFAFTDAQGRAVVTLTAGEAGDAAFQIEADTDDAAPVAWDVQVLTRALDVTGSYRVRSDFDLASGLPGTAGQVINTFIDMTDSPYDPATWVLDKVVENVGSSTVRNFINNSRPALDAILNELLIQATPDIVAKIIEMGDAFGQVARKFGTTSTLTVTETGDPDRAFAARHAMTGLVFTIDGTSYPYPFADMGLSVPATDVGFSYDAARFRLGAHEFPLSYGTILLVALEQIIIPLIESSAHDLESLLEAYVNCQAVGHAIAEYLGFGSPGLYQGACDLGLDAAAGWVENRILSLDGSAMVLGIQGDARWLDNNDDRRVDVLQGGTWTGAMTYIGTPAPLGPSTFRAERTATPQ